LPDGVQTLGCAARAVTPLAASPPPSPAAPRPGPALRRWRSWPSRARRCCSVMAVQHEGDAAGVARCVREVPPPRAPDHDVDVRRRAGAEARQVPAGLQRQCPRPPRQRRAAVGDRRRGRAHRVHRAGQPAGERAGRILQRQAARRTAERRGVQHTQGSPGADRGLAPALQRGTAALVAGLPPASPRDGADGQVADQLGSRSGCDGPLKSRLDHSMGAGHSSYRSGRAALRSCVSRPPCAGHRSALSRAKGVRRGKG